MMNAPFKSPRDRSVLAKASIGVEELKMNMAAVIAEAQKRQVAILDCNKPVAYVIAPHVWEYLCDLVEDTQDAELVRHILAEPGENIEVTIDELSADIRSSRGEVLE